ncbi:MAG: hypothetical protein HY308_17035 [Gammaproteobacteria bacterium]|nr:hypothetical protein [Gammaproteobacteria bacterium]
MERNRSTPRVTAIVRACHSALVVRTKICRRWYLRALVALIAAIGVVGSLPVSAEEILPVPDGELLKAADVVGSVGYLMEVYGIPQAEAMRRLELQRIAPQMHDWFARMLVDEYAGMWIDQANGGVLKILSTRPERVAALLQGLPDHDSMQAVKARWSFKQLQETEQRLEKKINTNKNPKIRVVELAIDVPNNIVGVFQRAGAEDAGRGIAGKELAAAHDKVLKPDTKIAAAVAAEGGRAAVKQLVAGGHRDSPVAAGCDPRTCAPPMRGGMRLNVFRNQAAPVGENLNAWWGQCTNGFNMYDTSRGWNYIMTAGHCMTGSYKVGQTYTYSASFHPVAYEVYNFENGPTGDSSTYPYDYSIQPYLDYNYWSGSYAKNQVDSWCWGSSSTWQGCVDGTFSIRGYYTYAQIGLGWVVCGTGAGDNSSDSGYASGYSSHPGTYCGEVKSKNGGIVTNICTRKGDSGGPLFSEIDGQAYGILSGGTEASGPCPTNPAGTERSWYSPIDKILSHVRSQTLYYEGRDYGFRLRTSP